MSATVSKLSTSSSTLTLAHNLAIIRVATGWTQQALADAAGVSRATVAQLEAGLGDPRLTTLQQIAEALRITPSALLFGAPDVLSLVGLRQSNDKPAFSVPPNVRDVLRHLVASGHLRHKLEAARIVLDIMQSAGISDTTQSIGAALGSARDGASGALAMAAFASYAGENKPQSLEKESA